MKLSEFLEGLDKDQKVKIGCIDGTNYLFAGKVKDFDPDFFRTDSPAMRNKVGQRGKYSTLKSNPKKKFKRRSPKSQHDYIGVDLEDRHVVQSFKSDMEPEVLAIMVDGDEIGVHWTVDPQPPLNADTINDSNLMDLMGGIYSIYTKPLTKAFEKYEHTLYDLRREINSIINQLRNFGWNIGGDDDEGVIRECWRQAKEAEKARRKREEEGLLEDDDEEEDEDAESESN